MRTKLIEMSPARFYAVTDVIESVKPDTRQWLEERCGKIKELAGTVRDTREKLSRSVRSMDDEIRGTVRRRQPTSTDEYEDIGRELAHTNGQDTNFLRVSHNITNALGQMYESLHQMTRDLQPGELALFRGDKTPRPKDHNDMQSMLGEVELNHAVAVKFLAACNELTMKKVALANLLDGVHDVLGIYHRALVNRHSAQGIQIHGDPVLTDIAITIYENIDAHGEVAEGSDPDKVSSYTVKKAEILASALKDDFTHGLIQYPDKLLDVISSTFLVMNNYVEELQTKLKPQLDKVLTIIDEQHPRIWRPIERHLEDLKDVNPRTVTFRDKNVLLTSDERYNLDFKNKTIAEVVELIKAKDLDIGDLIKYVLNRKQELRKFFQEENSFYVCRISAGNPFSGEAPGALQVIPGTRPNVKMNEILGSGYAEVVDFAGSIEAASEFHDLFVATSPSKTADKSNVLLVGPMGCGKSEVLRAVGADKKSIAIVAQGSDFNTCWKGEMEKNPKRLFEGAVKLQKESRRHVHICIDEIDSILNDDKEPGSTNLNLEFQILMDGVVHYPNISVWGATNHVQRIPMPMIRRFSKILVVGELSQEDRVTLLQAFFSYMPWDDIPQSAWDGWAKKLDGATGDVMRKIADVVWRKKMTDFVRTSPAKARLLTGHLNIGGKKFEVSNFDESQRRAFKAVLKDDVRVTVKDVDDSIRANLRNIGVLAEIQTAKETYSNAKKYLAHLANSV